MLVDAALGGYDDTRGFDKSLTAPVTPVEGEDGARSPPDAFDDDPDTVKDRIVSLPNHLRHVRDEAARLGGALKVPSAETRAVVTSSLWHDLGKAHDVFKVRCGLQADAPPLAKTPDYNWRVKNHAIASISATSSPRRWRGCVTGRKVRPTISSPI